MPLSKFKMYHGAVLTEVVRNPEMSLKLIERDSQRHSWGMYAIAAGKKDYILFCKSTAKIFVGRKNYSNFTFSVDDIRRIKEHFNQEILVCLVCHNQHICLLTKAEIEELKILDDNKSCRISVYWKQGTELTVKSTYAELSGKVARSRLKNFVWE